MSKFLRIFGISYAVLSIVIFFLAIEGMTFFGAVSLFSNAVLGISVAVIGELIERVSDLERKIGDRRETAKKEDSIQRIVCRNCGTKYDMDYPQCPHCKSKNPFLE